MNASNETETAQLLKWISPRELQVWRLAALGFSTKAAAVELGVAHKTADHQRGSLMGKLRAAGVEVRGVADLTRAAIRYGIIEVEVVS